MLMRLVCLMSFQLHLVEAVASYEHRMKLRCSKTSKASRLYCLSRERLFLNPTNAVFTHCGSCAMVCISIILIFLHVSVLIRSYFQVTV